MILECIPYRNTEVGKEWVKHLDHVNRVNPVNNIEFKMERIKRTRKNIEKHLVRGMCTYITINYTIYPNGNR